MRAKEKEQLNKTAVLEATILNYSKMSEQELYNEFSSGSAGFSEETAEELLDEQGSNEIDYGKTQPWFVGLMLSFVNPFSIVLLLVAGVSFITEVLLSDTQSWATVIIILTLVGISSVLQFVQESRSNSAAEKLKAMVSSNAAVIRGGVEREMPMRDIVKGDIVKLSAGDMMPADVRLLAAKDLFIGQAALTGESEPVEKYFELKNKSASALEVSNVCYMGTNVVSGSATAIVIGTGNSTYFGAIAKDLTGRKAQSSFERGVADVSKLLLRLIFVMVPIIFLVNGVSKQDWLGALLFALSVAVGITPELLPMIMTTTLAKGAVAMAKRKTIVKNLSSIQSFGAMDVLCTDKTGTLTEDQIILERYLDIHGKEDLRVLRHAYLNSYFQTGLKNVLDLAIITRFQQESASIDDMYTKVDEIPFDFNRRRMSVVLADKSGKRQLITKGAVEEMLKCCSYAEFEGKVIPFSDALRDEVLSISDKLNERGMRVIAVAQKNEVRSTGLFDVSDESDMVLIGFTGFLDPPKQSAKQAISALHEHGVRVVVLTGDNEKVASTVGKQVGLEIDEYIIGEQLDGYTDEALTVKLREVNLLAKLSPSQKMRVVRLLQADGHTVGYMGDGINDAPALHQSDVGISVDSGVDIAKESADIILLEKSLMVLSDGVTEGRRTFGNIIKYIKMASSGNFGNMFSVLAASIFVPFLPMLPIQILAQNLLYDFSQITIPLDRMDDEYLKKPQKWDAKGIERFMYYFGPLSSLFDILTFGVLFFIFKADSMATQSTFQTGWFMLGLVTQTLIVHLIRTAKIPFVESNATKPVILSTVIVSIMGIIIPYTFLGDALGMTAMPGWFLPFLAGIILMYAVAVQMLKKFYIRKYNSWI